MQLGFLLFFAASWAQVTYEEAFPNLTFQYPVEIQPSVDGTDRIFVVEQPGRIVVFPNDPGVTTAQKSVFLDLTGVVSYSSGQEIGLLGLAFHPNYNVNGYFYVYYTAPSSVSGINVEIVLARYQVSNTDPDSANPGSELILFSFDKNQSSSNHNGGKIAFGPDGYLYISVGDGGGAGDPNKNAQDLDNIFGSILRIDVDVDGSNPVEANPDLPDGNYEIPADNPRVGLSGLDELYAWGIRNTWKLSFDPPTNRLWGADVGQGDYEEINLITNGGNYGWDRFEGNSLEDTSTSLVTTPDIKPIFEYDHLNGDVSITGGYVYRGTSTDPLLQGKYIYGDYISGRVWSLDYNESLGTATSTELFDLSGQYISSFGLDESGELYFSNYGNSARIYRITGGTGGGTNTPVNGFGKWYTLESGVNGVVESLSVLSEDVVYVGGDFTSAGGISTVDMATYSPQNGWNAFGGGTNGKVNSIATDSNGNVYVGGEFTQIGGITANNIAFWNGTSWNAMGTGTDGPVAKIGVDSADRVYVGGVFVTAGGITVNNIALWTGSWSALTDAGNSLIGTNNEIRAIAFDENDVLYVGGNFDSAGGNSAPRIATWDGTNWGTLGLGTSGFVQAITIDAGFVYAGGNFAEAGGLTVNRIARWDRNLLVWEALGVGLSGNVRSLIQNGSYLYVGGSFETATDIPGTNKIVNNIARWSEGTGWEALGTNTNVGVSTQINALGFSSEGNNLFAGGNFTSAGLTSALNIARWNAVDCASTPITIEYQRNSGSWTVAGNEIQVVEGEAIGLSTVESDTDFEITLPDGTKVTGNYTIPGIMESDEGMYLFTLSNGCYEVLSIIVNPPGDDDNDGVDNTVDLCPNTPAGEYVDANGCSQSQLDDDNDGVSNDLDQCPNTPAGASVNSEGCAQSQLDDDNDGVNNDLDQCPNTPAGATVNSVGCAQSQLDDDNDGVSNDQDLCPNTPSNETADANGCSPSQLDDDNDGVSNAVDQCPNTPAGATVDQFGCEAGQLDGDNDGVTNDLDLCPNTPNGESVDADGCSQSQLDDDNDGVSNDLDQCPNTAPGIAVDSTGCPVTGLPSDNFVIAVTSNSCPGQANGLLNISAVQALSYTAQITSASYSQTFNFSQNLEVTDLIAGTYEICITVSEIPAYEFCGRATVSEPEELSVDSSINSIDGTLTLLFSGASLYTVEFNSQIFKTGSDKMTLELKKEVNTVKVYTEQDCQGEYMETIYLAADAVVFPNPFQDEIHVQINRPDSRTVQIDVFAENGSLVVSQENEVIDGLITLNASALPGGIYFIKVSTPNFVKNFKVIKK
ncbi:PQQ-dependent sugar dehydrogenase [Muriicola marianensis]|uniref:PQQ-dependent sugar dehydrogenase n=1 Tax=Muriicola marianensis TaxID=1324801 RepID=UPI00166834D9|nr:PQQ-dependent sugar dehydrogenase [Muriicola marianensis]